MVAALSAPIQGPEPSKEMEMEVMDRFVEVANRVADAAGEVPRKYFRRSFVIIDKEDLSMHLPLLCIFFFLDLYENFVLIDFL